VRSYDNDPLSFVPSSLPVRIDYPTFSRRLYYDRLKRLNRAVDELGAGAEQAVSYDYDAAGNLISATDEEGKKTAYQYDALNRLTEITDPAGEKTTLGYDRRDNIVKVQDPKGGNTFYNYDKAGRVIKGELWGRC